METIKLNKECIYNTFIDYLEMLIYKKITSCHIAQISVERDTWNIAQCREAFAIYYFCCCK